MKSRWIKCKQTLFQLFLGVTLPTSSGSNAGYVAAGVIIILLSIGVILLIAVFVAIIMRKRYQKKFTPQVDSSGFQTE